VSAAEGLAAVAYSSGDVRVFAWFSGGGQLAESSQDLPSSWRAAAPRVVLFGGGGGASGGGSGGSGGPAANPSTLSQAEEQPARAGRGYRHAASLPVKSHDICLIPSNLAVALDLSHTGSGAVQFSPVHSSPL